MRVGVVFSGGGARGIAHLGGLQALEELGIRPAMISGVSAGALIGALYAAGKSPGEILEMIKQQSHSSLAAAMLFPGGLFSYKGLRNLLKSVIPSDDFADLKIPLTVTATDLVTGTSVRFSQGNNLYDVLLGSAAVPGLFDPVKVDNHQLADGGILDNLPVVCIRDSCDKVLGIHVNKFYEGAEKLNRLQVIDRCFHLAIGPGVAANAMLCDLLVEPDTSGCTIFDTQKAGQLFTAGYKAMMYEKKVLKSWSAEV
jgi:NTE family protein